MDWTEITKLAIELVLAIVTALLSAFVIPWLKNKIAELKANVAEAGYAQLIDMIDRFVAAAEQIGINDDRDGEWKKRYVKEMIQCFCGIDEIDDELNSYIESSVITLHKALYGEVE